MTLELSDDLKMLKAQIRRFVDTEIIPVEREATDGFDMKPEYRARFEAMTKELGYWFVELSEDQGGLGLGLIARVLLWEEMGRTIACPPRKQSIFGPEVSPILFNLTPELMMRPYYIFSEAEAVGRSSEWIGAFGFEAVWTPMADWDIYVDGRGGNGAMVSSGVRYNIWE